MKDEWRGYDSTSDTTEATRPHTGFRRWLDRLIIRRLLPVAAVAGAVVAYIQIRGGR